MSNEAELHSSRNSLNQRNSLSSHELGFMRDKGLAGAGGINQVDEEDEAMEESKNQYNIGVKKSKKPEPKPNMGPINEDDENESFDLNEILNGPSLNQSQYKSCSKSKSNSASVSNPSGPSGISGPSQ